MARFRYNSKARPPTQTTMHILDSDYQYLLDRRDFSNQPAYDILHKILLELESIKDEQTETREFLEMAIEDKKAFRRENEELRQRVKRLESTVAAALSGFSNSALLIDRSIYLNNRW